MGATHRRIKPVRRMHSAHPSKAGSQKLEPGPNATRYELQLAAKSKQKADARNMTPQGYRPECTFNTLMARKEGNAEKMADGFVPNPYTADADRIVRENKTNNARWLGGAFLTATGTRPIRKLNYGSDPYKTFSFDRVIHKDKWMRDQDFIKMGRTLQPFDGPLKEPKKPPKRRPHSRA